MIKTYRILSSLLDYPEQELWENLGEVEPLVKAEGITETGPESPLGTFLSWARGFKSLREWQAEYSSLFDSNSAESLYLFDFVYGTNRDRGQAMEDPLQAAWTAAPLSFRTTSRSSSNSCRRSRLKRTPSGFSPRWAVSFA